MSCGTEQESRERRRDVHGVVKRLRDQPQRLITNKGTRERIETDAERVHRRVAAFGSGHAVLHSQEFKQINVDLA